MYVTVFCVTRPVVRFSFVRGARRLSKGRRSTTVCQSASSATSDHSLQTRAARATLLSSRYEKIRASSSTMKIGCVVCCCGGTAGSIGGRGIAKAERTAPHPGRYLFIPRQDEPPASRQARPLRACVRTGPQARLSSDGTGNGRRREPLIGKQNFWTQTQAQVDCREREHHEPGGLLSRHRDHGEHRRRTHGAPGLAHGVHRRLCVGEME